MVNGDLYLRIIIFLAPCMKCVKTRELDYLIDELINYFSPLFGTEKVLENRMKTHARSVVLGKVFFFFLHPPSSPKFSTSGIAHGCPNIEFG